MLTFINYFGLQYFSLAPQSHCDLRNYNPGMFEKVLKRYHQLDQILTHMHVLVDKFVNNLNIPLRPSYRA